MTQENQNQPITCGDVIKSFCRIDTMENFKRSLFDLFVGYLISDISNDQHDRQDKVSHYEHLVELLDDIQRLQRQQAQA